MNKYGWPDEEDYQTVRDVIKRMAADASNVLESHKNG
jgi:hypothetical protein